MKARLSVWHLRSCCLKTESEDKLPKLYRVNKKIVNISSSGQVSKHHQFLHLLPVMNIWRYQNWKGGQLHDLILILRDLISWGQLCTKYYTRGLSQNFKVDAWRMRISANSFRVRHKEQENLKCKLFRVKHFFGSLKWITCHLTQNYFFFAHLLPTQI